MRTIQLSDVELEHVDGPEAGNSFRFAFPLHRAAGTNDSAVVYMELEPGMHLGTHTDSQEEVVLVLEGTAEATVGENRGTLTAGGAVVIPAMAPHDVRNVGAGPLRAIGFFSGAVVYSTFTPSPVPGTEGLLSVNGVAGGEAVYALQSLEE